MHAGYVGCSNAATKGHNIHMLSEHLPPTFTLHCQIQSLQLRQNQRPYLRQHHSASYTFSPRLPLCLDVKPALQDNLNAPRAFFRRDNLTEQHQPTPSDLLQVLQLCKLCGSGHLSPGSSDGSEHAIGKYRQPVTMDFAVPDRSAATIDQQLCRQLRDLPREFDFRYTDGASKRLIEVLFRSLVGRREGYLRLLFPHGPPTNPEARWSLRDAQGAVEGAEYTEAARGHPCGHIFKNGEATYRCRTCTADDTCVLCAKCFDASDHEGHTVYVSVSPGNSGCCDCGDPEAWLNPAHCTIHSELPTAQHKSAGKAKQGSPLPPDLLVSMRTTIARVLDYLCDVWSCSPEQLRLPKTESSVTDDEWQSRLNSAWYGAESVDEDQEFALVLWNDEKHTVNDVRDTVARACKQTRRQGLMKAHEVDEIGRSVLLYSRDLSSLLQMAKIIEQPKLTVTIRSARDTFREYMCGTIVEWIADIAGCSVGSDKEILRQTICEEILNTWRVGSKAHHGTIGKDGIDDHEVEDVAAEYLSIYGPARILHLRRSRRNQAAAQDNDDETEDIQAVDEDQDEMDVDDESGNSPDRDMDMDISDELDDALEASEATLAGYPPPPPPPPAPFGTRRVPGVSGDGDLGPANEPQIMIPRTPKVKQGILRHPPPPKYWLERPSGYARKAGIPPHEDLWRRVRLDFLILYDLRMWKKLRTDLRDVFISTVVNLPAFKRLLGLRFAGVYTVLAELYLIADREPDHSITNLSLQMLTTPSITAEVVERGNFLTNLMAILYTFLTTRQVGYPSDVDPLATLAFEQGAVNNRRICQFYMDMKYLLLSDLVQEKIRTEEKYLLQFLDLAKLHQGICPNVRAIGEHIEYETDAWFTASLVTAEIMRLCRWVADAFSIQCEQDLHDLSTAIRNTARVTTIHSLGSERRRFDQAEIRTETRFETLPAFEFDTGYPDEYIYRIVNFDVTTEPMSFYHPLHYTLSWLIDRGKMMSSDEMRQLLLFSTRDLYTPPSPYKAVIPERTREENLLSLFDFPIRVCSWLAQMRAGLWVRNGMTLRHQMNTYRNVPRKDLGYQRDIFLIQVALVVCSPATVLASIVNRYAIMDWVTGDFTQYENIDEQQKLDIAEDFVHLLIILLTERTHLRTLEEDPNPSLTVARRDIIHALCSKPLSHSELLNKLSEKISDSIEFGDLLEEMTTYRPPEGLTDSGTFALKDNYFAEIEPYLAHFSRNQREEAETVYRKHVASKTGKDPSEIVYEPKLAPIKTGIFKDLAEFTRTSLFSQIIFYFLHYAKTSSTHTPSIPTTKVEQFLQFVLHLVLAAVLEDSEEPGTVNIPDQSFSTSVLCKRSSTQPSRSATIADLLRQIADNEAFKACEPKIRVILRHLRHKRPAKYTTWMHSIDQPVERSNNASPASAAALEKELKKKQALDRQAKVMAQFKQQQATFMANQMDWGDEDFSDLDGEIATPTEEEEEKIWKFPTGKCILCQEETTSDKLYGTFALINDSRILRQTNVDDEDWVAEVLETPQNLDRSAEAMRPVGVARKNRRVARKVTADGRVWETERQELGKGFPNQYTKRGPVATGCGHIMHYSCFEIFLNATQRRHLTQIARNHPERLDYKEFLCPLCKALGNTFLPIIWKGKNISYPGVLQPEVDFSDFLNSEIAVQLSKLEKAQEETHSGKAPTASHRSERLFLGYGDDEIIPRLANQLGQLTNPKTTYHTAPAPNQRQTLLSQLPAFLQFGPDDAYFSMLAGSGTSDNPTVPEQLMELIKVYQRLRDTTKVNHLGSMYTYPNSSSSQDDLTYTDTLARSLGYSIAATEIAQRGVESSPGHTLLEKISTQTLTHLRVLSESVSTYIAIGGLRAGGANATYREFSDNQKRQLHQLFISHTVLRNPDDWLSGMPHDLKLLQPLLAQDQFIFLAEAAVCLVPSLHLDIHHVMRLCYLAEILRVIIAYRNSFISELDINGIPEFDYPRSFFEFLNHLPKPEAGGVELTWASSAATLDEAQLRAGVLFKLIETYVLPFLRKCVILMHIRYGIEFPTLDFSPDEPEIVRLSCALKLPYLDELFAESLSNPTSATLIGWLQHWKLSHDFPRHAGTITLSHPAIFELIGLPKTFDTLQDEVMKCRCPTTGKDLTDPCVCLFCGEIFCGQAVCCTSEDSKGGCFQHRAKYVSKNRRACIF